MSDDPEQKLGEVYYDRDPSWQHELVSGFLRNVVAVDLCQLTGRTPSGMHFISLLVEVSTLCSYVDIAFMLCRQLHVKIAAQWTITTCRINIPEQGTRLCLDFSRFGSNGCSSICCS